ncbi:MAG TPA: hypothetical protein VN154_09030 [Rhizomicrobium sp.]|nr:hypothetical protein [Rhizomicrobium sp.]
MIRLLNFFCFAVTAFACLALYHISEETRVARVELRSVERQIADQDEAMRVLEADWERVADPARIQRLAQSKLGVDDQPVALASLELLPRRDKQEDLQQANAETAPSNPHLQTASLHEGE